MFPFSQQKQEEKYLREYRNLSYDELLEIAVSKSATTDRYSSEATIAEKKLRYYQKAVFNKFPDSHKEVYKEFSQIQLDGFIREEELKKNVKEVEKILQRVRSDEPDESAIRKQIREDEEFARKLSESD